MKRLLIIFIALVLIFFMSLALTSCGGNNVRIVISKLNAECPLDLGNGFTRSSAFIDGKQAFITCVVDSNLTSDNFEKNISEKKAALLQDLKEDASLCTVLKDSGTDIVYRYKFSDGTVDVLIACEEM